MRHSTKLTAAVAVAISSLVFTEVSQANFVADMSRISADASANTVRINCGNGVDGFDLANATISNTQEDGRSKVKIKIKNAAPNTLYTVWVRLKGTDQEGNSFGGSPITGGGATALAPSTSLDELVENWIGSGSSSGANVFTTNNQGKGTLFVDLDFPLEGGVYPFNNISGSALADVRMYKNPAALATPTAIIDPRQNGVNGPFFIRVVSHCLDGLSHGLSPDAREPWFQYP